jgi:hypothetical protein
MPFDGFTLPRYTPIPDQLIDELMPQLTMAELRIALYITRRTFGFKKEADNISLDQLANGIRTKDGRVLDAGTGLSRRSLLPALKSLESKRIIVRKERKSANGGSLSSVYSLNLYFIELNINSRTYYGQTSVPTFFKSIMFSICILTRKKKY